MVGVDEVVDGFDAFVDVFEACFEVFCVVDADELVLDGLEDVLFEFEVDLLEEAAQFGCDLLFDLLVCAMIPASFLASQSGLSIGAWCCSIFRTN